MRTINNLTGLLFGIVAGALLMLTMLPAHSAPPEALPHEKPASATGFMKCQQGSDVVMVIAIVFTYPSGKYVRVDMQHMYGMPNAGDLVKYATSADDQKIYKIDCEKGVAT